MRRARSKINSTPGGIKEDEVSIRARKKSQSAGRRRRKKTAGPEGAERQGQKAGAAQAWKNCVTHFACDCYKHRLSLVKMIAKRAITDLDVAAKQTGYPHLSLLAHRHLADLAELNLA